MPTNDHLGHGHYSDYQTRDTTEDVATDDHSNEQKLSTLKKMVGKDFDKAVKGWKQLTKKLDTTDLDSHTAGYINTVARHVYGYTFGKDDFYKSLPPVGEYSQKHGDKEMKSRVNALAKKIKDNHKEIRGTDDDMNGLLKSLAQSEITKRFGSTVNVPSVDTTEVVTIPPDKREAASGTEGGPSSTIDVGNPATSAPTAKDDTDRSVEDLKKEAKRERRREAQKAQRAAKKASKLAAEQSSTDEASSRAGITDPDRDADTIEPRKRQSGHFLTDMDIAAASRFDAKHPETTKDTMRSEGPALLKSGVTTRLTDMTESRVQPIWESESRDGDKEQAKRDFRRQLAEQRTESDAGRFEDESWSPPTNTETQLVKRDPAVYTGDTTQSPGANAALTKYQSPANIPETSTGLTELQPLERSPETSTELSRYQPPGGDFQAMTQYQPPTSAPEIAPTDPQEIIRDMYSNDKQNDYSMPMTQFGGFGHSLVAPIFQDVFSNMTAIGPTDTRYGHHETSLGSMNIAETVGQDSIMQCFEFRTNGPGRIQDLLPSGFEDPFQLISLFSPSSRFGGFPSRTGVSGYNPYRSLGGTTSPMQGGWPRDRGWDQMHEDMTSGFPRYGGGRRMLESAF